MTLLCLQVASFKCLSLFLGNDINIFIVFVRFSIVIFYKYLFMLSLLFLLRKQVVSRMFCLNF